MLGEFTGKFDKAVTDDNGNVIVSFMVCGNDRRLCKQAVQSVKTAVNKGKELLQITLDTQKKKRSLNANAYCWVLCEKIAEVLSTTNIEIYQKFIKEQGVYREFEISENAVQMFITAWGMHGIGWLVEKIDYAQYEGYVTLHAYYGSSTYNQKQMARLIESIVQECGELDIETKTPDEIARMISLWGEHN